MTQVKSTDGIATEPTRKDTHETSHENTMGAELWTWTPAISSTCQSSSIVVARATC